LNPEEKREKDPGGGMAQKHIERDGIIKGA
jgi:hypothetical protein